MWEQICRAAPVEDDRGVSGFRTALGIRGVALAGLGAWLGLRVFNQPAPTGVAVLTGLLLVLADFHGDPRRRLRAYLVTATAGAALVGVGTAAGSLPIAALALVVATLAGLLALLRNAGGLLVSAGTALLADLLVGAAAGIQGDRPAPLAAAALMGGLLATGLAFTIGPAPWVSPVRGATSSLLDACASVLAGSRPGADLRDTATAMVGVYLARPERPASPLPSAQASVSLLADLTFLADVLGSGHAPRTNASAADVLRSSRQCLAHPRSTTDLVALTSALRRLDQPTSKTSFDDAAVMQASRAVGRHTLQMLPGAAGHSWWLPPGLWGGVRDRLTSDSPVARAVAATAVLFGVLVLAADYLPTTHPQWILLVAVSAFYPSASRAATKSGAIVVGTLVGAMVFLGVAAILSPSNPGWWLVLLLAAGISMSAPHSSSGTLLGQGFFTVLSLTLLTLATAGTSVAAVPERAVDVALGTAAAVLVALALAPRHLRARTRRAIADLMLTSSKAITDAPTGGDSLPRLAAEAQSQFLRCVDIADIGSGGRGWDRGDAADWLDGARVVAQACSVVAVCKESDEPNPVTPTWSRAGEALSAQRDALLRDVALPSPPVVPQWVGNDVWSAAAVVLFDNMRRQAEQLRTLTAHG